MQRSWKSRLAGVLGALALMLGPALTATHADPLSLDEAMQRARERAREMRAADARQAAREAQVEVARSHRLPTVTLSELWIRTDAPAEVFALELNQERFSFQDFVAGDPNNPDPLSSATTRLALELPLYTGGALAARLEQAELGVDAAEAHSRRVRDEVALAAAEAFLRLTQTREHVALLERSLDTVRAHADLARARVDEGMLVRSELLRAEVEAARIADLLSSARSRAAVAEAALSMRLAAPLDSTWTLDVLPALPELAPLGDWLTHADARPDLLAARRHQQIAALQTTVERAARRPQVGVQMRYDLVDEDLFGSDGDSSAIVAVASLDLFTGGRHRAAAAAADAEAEAVAADVERFADGVQLEIRQAHAEAQSARERLATAQSALDAAAETERILSERFAQGLVKTVDLLDATTARRESETRALVAQTDTHLSTLRLQLAAGPNPRTGTDSFPEP
ncbi:MAG: TolC family protein [Acidobacteriota bacterium]